MSRHNRGAQTGVLALLAAAGLVAVSYRALSRRNFQRHPGDSAPGRTARQTRFGDFAVTGKTITINRPRTELFAYWRDFSNLAGFMENIVSIQPTGEDRTVWTIKAPGGQTVDVETEIVEERDGELIAWRSVEGSEIEAEGKVFFRDASADRGTEVEAIVAYKPPAGEVGRWIGKLFGREPGVQGRRELKRFKMLMETGEIADACYHAQS
ncbi:SRPBCC family protein [Pelagibacterium sp. 26DY04]|uniref:SRPBCC family protein n=1 Tax=Pelagibacterium sp. 26DY04 TaxID=2967130 RepID=UPI002815D7E7|nr:SRPBCC family protein [Pelagibacterium sp. 26DY04]WMT86371.1 SRPBCC family protein [Pelagibacterium sp. 26DY04]